MEWNPDILQRAANEARGLAIDAVHRCSSGHLGLPLGCAEVGATLFAHCLNYNPYNPRWWNRDRFILSAGHGSMFLYTWLHISGYDLSMEDLRNFRVLHSKTPGHPEYGETPGVECTTGPLGQGVGNAVGMAMSGKMLQARFNTAEHQIFDYRVVCLAGDGCLQEGVAREAVALAGHQGLDNLILLFDSNDVTLDAQAAETQSEDVSALYEAIGWDVWTVSGHDLDLLKSTYHSARDNLNGRPKIIILRTEVGRGIPEVAGTWKAHGEGGAKFAESARKGLGLPEKTFHLSDEVRDYFRQKALSGKAKNAAWDQKFEEWKKENPSLASILESGYSARPDPESLLEQIPEFAGDQQMATRVAGGKALNALAAQNPLIISGSADLHGSTKNYLDDSEGDFSRENRRGRNIRFGIREHAMGAIVNGFGYDSPFIASGATFFTFSDYMRPSVRLSALAGLPVTWYWTHDSVGVGEDGPTHQPVEHLAACRAIPNLDVIRPADPEEAAGALAAAVSRKEGPTALVLSRQNVPTLGQIPVKTRREGALRGAYIARKESDGPLQLILLASGSELHLALEAAKQLGPQTRVVSMPCMERFERQSADYREQILPSSCRARVAVEAASGQPWQRYVGLDGKLVCIDRFGLSAPGNQIMSELGITADRIAETGRSLLPKT